MVYEVHSAMARRYRERSFTEAGYQLATRQFEADFSNYARIDVRAELLTSAKFLSTRHALRALDAVHLASALRFQERLAQPVVFVAADRRLLTAAEAEGMKIFDVERPHARMKDFPQAR